MPMTIPATTRAIASSRSGIWCSRSSTSPSRRSTVATPWRTWGRTNIDTGSGLERLACVIQGKRNNFDIDLLQIIVQKVAALTGVAYVMDAAADSEEGGKQQLIRRIADHARAVTFCIADGALPEQHRPRLYRPPPDPPRDLDIDKLGVSVA